jgi:hypothetical protein
LLAAGCGGWLSRGLAGSSGLGRWLACERGRGGGSAARAEKEEEEVGAGRQLGEAEPGPPAARPETTAHGAQLMC